MGKSLIIIGLVWPEPKSTAAGIRMMQLIRLFLKHDYKITFACSSSKTDLATDLSVLGVNEVAIKLNDPNLNNKFDGISPDIIMFDRYLTEEQFGWKLQEIFPEALRLLDTEDLHFLRKARENIDGSNEELLDEILTSEITKREIASIYRCDLSLIISEFELQLLKKDFNIDGSLLFYLPFLLDYGQLEKQRLSYDQRTDFITVGTFKHQPNVDATHRLKNDIWPLIRSQLPKAQLNIYGSYVSQKIFEMHNESEGFHIKGFIEDIDGEMESARVCLAPLRFGAGLKGKVVNALVNGTPCVMSNIAAEGIFQTEEGNGFIEDDWEQFAEKAVRLYKDENYWTEVSKIGLATVYNNFSSHFYEDKFINVLKDITSSLTNHRKRNFIGQMLNHHSLKSTKYLGKWIEEKNK